jgi:hypothetical protein
LAVGYRVCPFGYSLTMTGIATGKARVVDRLARIDAGGMLADLGVQCRTIVSPRTRQRRPAGIIDRVLQSAVLCCRATARALRKRS